MMKTGTSPGLFEHHGSGHMGGRPCSLCSETGGNPIAGRSGRLRSLPSILRRAFQKPAPPPLPPALDWVDEFIARVRHHVVVRLEDHLLIRMPNQAHRLNPTGARILHYLLQGGTMGDLAVSLGQQQERLKETALFLYEVRRCLSGELREDSASRAVEIVPLEVRFSDLPVLSEVALTRQCNLKCLFCYGGCGPGQRRAVNRDMHTRQVMTILTNIRDQAHVPSVSFTGGEPTLRRDLVALVRFAARSLGMRVNLITNGTLITKGLAGRLAKAGLASAQVSLEGPDASTHDAITGVPGSFDRSVTAVALLKATGIEVHTNTTINQRNLHAIEQMPAFTRDVLQTERLSMNLVIPVGSAARWGGNREDSILVRYRDLSPAIEAVQQAAARVGVTFMWYSPTPLCLFNPIVKDLGNKGCSACDGLLSINASGQVLPCSSCQDPVGNLLEEDFQEIWNRAESATYRNKKLAHPACRRCEHFAFCHGACPLYWKHFGFEELVETCGFEPVPRPQIPLVSGDRVP